MRRDGSYAPGTTLARQSGPLRRKSFSVCVAAMSGKTGLEGGMTAEQEASYRQLVDLGHRFRSKWICAEDRDHSEMYDEYGLPL